MFWLEFRLSTLNVFIFDEHVNFSRCFCFWLDCNLMKQQFIFVYISLSGIEIFAFIASEIQYSFQLTTAILPVETKREEKGKSSLTWTTNELNIDWKHMLQKSILNSTWGIHNLTHKIYNLLDDNTIQVWRKIIQSSRTLINISKKNINNGSTSGQQKLTVIK